MVCETTLKGVFIVVKLGKQPAMPGDSQGLERSHGRITLRNSTKGTRARPHLYGRERCRFRHDTSTIGRLHLHRIALGPRAGQKVLTL
jgi:hypothetical protein